MKQIDIRLTPAEKRMLENLTGKELESIIHESYLYSQTVNFVIALKAKECPPVYVCSDLEVMDHYGEEDDVAVLHIRTEPPINYDTLELIEIPINEMIHSIDLVQENQKEFFGDMLEYDNHVTRGIIFNLDDSQLSIEKSIWFSDSFIIERGANLIETYAPTSEFEADWAPGHSAKCIRTIETL